MKKVGWTCGGRPRVRGDVRQATLFEEAQPRWVKVDASAVRVENLRQRGGPWLLCELIRRLKLDEFLRRVMPRGREIVRRAALRLGFGRMLRPTRIWSPL